MFEQIQIIKLLQEIATSQKEIKNKITKNNELLSKVLKSTNDVGIDK